MLVWYKWRVESVIARDWRKARRCAKESLLTRELEFGVSLPLRRGDGTEISEDETRNQK